MEPGENPWGKPTGLQQTITSCWLEELPIRS